MAISDLTGYTWVANNALTWEYSGNRFTYNLNFTSNNTQFNSFFVDDDDPSLTYGAVIVYTESYIPWHGWANEAYKTIVISGGTDATNATLIAWLEANGTLTAPAPSISDLTGTKWLINSAPVLSPLTYNETDPMLGEYGQYDFEIEGSSYDNVEIQGITLVGDQWGLTINIGMQIYDGEDWFEGEGFRTIEITGGSDVTNTSLIAWLEANATQVVSATPSLNFGGSDVSLFLGSTYVSKVYLGSTLLYEGEAPSASTISFTINGTTYQATQGMTWENWVESNYNTAGYYSQIGAIWEASGNNVVGRFVDENHISSTPVNPTDTITANSEYTLVSYGGGN